MKSEITKFKAIFFTITILMLIVFCAFSYCVETSENRINHLISDRNNHWAHHGSKSVKEKVYQLEKNEILAFSSKLNDSPQKEVLTIILKNLNSEINRYRKELEDLQTKAILADQGVSITENWLAFFYIGKYLSGGLLGLLILYYIFCGCKLKENT